MTINKGEALKLARETAEKELAHYLDKLWKIFSWASTILISITGGVIALRYGDTSRHLAANDKVGLVIAVIVLIAYTLAQLYLILSFETKARDKIESYDEKLGLDKISTVSGARDRPDRHPASTWLGYMATIVLLGATAIYAIVCGP